MNAKKRFLAAKTANNIRIFRRLELSKMASEFRSTLRTDHEGWKIAVRNARLIEDGKGSVIGKIITKPKKSSTRYSKRNDKNREEVKLPALVKKNGRKNERKIFHRNNPHPRINFPFPTGDRLKTYMVWSAHTGMEPPPFLRQNFPPRPKLRQTTNALNEGYKTVYQLEISEIPAKMRYGVDTVNYQSPELIKHSPYATKYSWATGGFMRDDFPSFKHHNVLPITSRLGDRGTK